MSLLPLQGGLDVLQRHFTDERLPTSVRGKALDLVTDLANHGLPQPMVRITQSYLRAVMFSGAGLSGGHELNGADVTTDADGA